jgi:hypothetical protein
MTLKIMPSEKGSMLSTSSSSAFPPMVIIYRAAFRDFQTLKKKSNLVHLFQLARDLVESRHELVKTLFAQGVVFLLALVAFRINCVQILGSC